MLDKFAKMPDVPEGACAPVWLSKYPEKAHAYCKHRGQAGHTTFYSGAYAVLAGWRARCIALLLISARPAARIPAQCGAPGECTDTPLLDSGFSGPEAS